MLNKIEASQVTKLAIFIAIGFIVGLLLLSRSGGDQPLNESPRALKLTQESVEQPSELPEPQKLGREMLSGGLASAVAPNEEVRGVVARVKPLLESQTKTKYEYIEVLSYKPQVVAGKNYFVKAKAKPVGQQEGIIHLRIYKNLSNEVELTAYQLDKTENEELKYFQ